MSRNRKKFQIRYPQDHPDDSLCGEKYKPPENCFVVMNGGGVFFLVNSDGWECYVKKLSDVIPKYNVVWL